MRHRFHAICPYFAMFPESFVRKHVLAWSAPGDLVLDPFSGRGTTVFESLLNGRPAIGCDTNPVAVCVSRAKASPPQLRSVIARLEGLSAEFPKFRTQRREVSDEFFTACYHPATLKQLLFLRHRLRWRESKVDCFVAALALGALHGESHRSEMCFSNRMPRTISTKPNYSVRWWREKGCVAPERDVFSILRAAAQFRYVSEVPKSVGNVVEGDARNAASMHRGQKGKVKLVVTSPPYLDITDYHEDQWLRLWFLGGRMRPLAGQKADDRHHRVDSYWIFLAEAWAGVIPLLHKSCQIVVRIGGTRLGPEELAIGLLKSLNGHGSDFRLQEFHRTEVRNGQKRAFGVKNKVAAVEFDFRFSRT